MVQEDLRYFSFVFLELTKMTSSQFNVQHKKKGYFITFKQLTDDPLFVTRTTTSP